MKRLTFIIFTLIFAFMGAKSAFADISTSTIVLHHSCGLGCTATSSFDYNTQDIATQYFWSGASDRWDYFKIDYISGNDIYTDGAELGGSSGLSEASQYICAGCYIDTNTRTGNYIFITNDNGTGKYTGYIPDHSKMYEIFNISNGITTFLPFPVTFQSGISLTTPIPQTYFFNPIHFGGSYIQAGLYDTLVFDIVFTDTDTPINIATSTLYPLSSGFFNWGQNLSMPFIGNYSARVKLMENSTGSSTAWSNTVSFGLASTSIDTSISSTTGMGALEALKNQTCGSFDIVCAIQKGLAFLFAPSVDSLQQFVGLKAQIEHKPPFGYFSLLSGALSSTTASTTPAFVIIVPAMIQNNIFTPLRTGIELILWFVALVWLYNRLKHIQL